MFICLIFPLKLDFFLVLWFFLNVDFFHVIYMFRCCFFACDLNVIYMFRYLHVFVVVMSFRVLFKC